MTMAGKKEVTCTNCKHRFYAEPEHDWTKFDNTPGRYNEYYRPTYFCPKCKCFFNESYSQDQFEK